MVEIMKKAIKHGQSITPEERRLLGAAYKQTVGKKRIAWRRLNTLIAKEESFGETEHVQLLTAMQLQVDEELDAACQEVVEVTKLVLKKHNMSDESRLFMQKMQADYYRYMAEYQKHSVNSQQYGNVAAQNAVAVYEDAIALAEEELEEINPVRLGLILNYAVFKYEVEENLSEALNIVTQTYQRASPKIKELIDHRDIEAVTLIQLIRDNMMIWKTELENIRDE